MDWRLAREVKRRGELVRLLFWLLHARLIYNLLRNYGPTMGMVHERRKEYKLNNTIAKVEQRTKEWHLRTIGTVQLKRNNPLRRWSKRGKKPKEKLIK